MAREKDHKGRCLLVWRPFAQFRVMLRTILSRSARMLDWITDLICLERCQWFIFIANGIGCAEKSVVIFYCWRFCVKVGKL